MTQGVTPQNALELVNQAERAAKITPSAAENIKIWLSEPHLREFVGQLCSIIAQERWAELDEAFWTIIPFGTGGRRGKMFPVGCNAINDRTIGESAQGLADYVKQAHPSKQSFACAIAYDTRHRSREFAQLCAEVMAGNGFRVYLLDDYRSTPELSFAVRHFQADCGLMITASHNPPSDNAVKAYWSTGGQLLPPHDAGVIQCVKQVKSLTRMPLELAQKQGRYSIVHEEVDAAYVAAVSKVGFPGPRSLNVLYSPMHGVGASSVVSVLKADGFTQVEVFAPHANPSGDFPNVPGHVANPENAITYDALIQHAQGAGSDLILSTDPDADRLGCAARKTAGGPFAILSGNQIGALLTEFVLQKRNSQGTLGPSHFVVKTLVTSELIRRIAVSHGAMCVGELPVGFKWIAGAMDEQGADKFVFGAEESHGFLAGDYVRDKDAAVAAMLLAEMAAEAQSRGETLCQRLDSLYWQHGCHMERTVSCTMPGSQGMAKMTELMLRFRQSPPAALGGLKLVRVRDYGNLICRDGSGKTSTLDAIKSDMVVLDLSASAKGPGGNFVAIRPSGTEPKVKLYLFAFEAPELIADLESTKVELAARLDAMEQDLHSLAS